MGDAFQKAELYGKCQIGTKDRKRELAPTPAGTLRLTRLAEVKHPKHPPMMQ